MLGVENIVSEPKETSQDGSFFVMGRTRSMALFLEFGEDDLPATVLQPLPMFLSAFDSGLCPADRNITTAGLLLHKAKPYRVQDGRPQQHT